MARVFAVAWVSKPMHVPWHGLPARVLDVARAFQPVWLDVARAFKPVLFEWLFERKTRAKSPCYELGGTMSKYFIPSLLAFVLCGLALRALADHENLPKPGADGFIELFNGKDLTGWEGLPGLWSVKDGAIVGSETREGSKQTDLILSASKTHPEAFANFELHLKYKLVTPTGNSGIQFRSKIDKPEMLHVGGYQADIDDKGGYCGSIYDESGIAGGRGTMSNRGEKTVWDADNKRHNTPLGESNADLKKVIHLTGDWNDVVLNVNGNHVTYSINGHVMTDLTDDSPKAVKNGGVIAFQMHAGFTMEIQFKDVKIKMIEGKGT
jgi:hypothetical protein